jgi:hypothetical protein
MRERLSRVFVVGALTLSACARQDYIYVALTGDNVEVVESGQPPRGFWRIGGDAIPVRYSVRDLGTQLTISLGKDGFTPVLTIVSSVPLRAVEASPLAHAIPTRPPREYNVLWSYSQDGRSSVHVGDTVQMRIEIENREEPVLLSGVIKKSGFWFFSDI